MSYNDYDTRGPYSSGSNNNNMSRQPPPPAEYYSRSDRTRGDLPIRDNVPGVLPEQPYPARTPRSRYAQSHSTTASVSSYGGSPIDVAPADQWPLPSRPFARPPRSQSPGGPRNQQRPYRAEYSTYQQPGPSQQYRSASRAPPVHPAYRQPPPPQYQNPGSRSGNGYYSPQPYQSHYQQRFPPPRTNQPVQEYSRAQQQAAHAQLRQAQGGPQHRPPPQGQPRSAHRGQPAAYAPTGPPRSIIEEAGSTHSSPRDVGQRSLTAKSSYDSGETVPRYYLERHQYEPATVSNVALPEGDRNDRQDAFERSDYFDEPREETSPEPVSLIREASLGRKSKPTLTTVRRGDSIKQNRSNEVQANPRSRDEAAARPENDGLSNDTSLRPLRPAMPGGWVTENPTPSEQSSRGYDAIHSPEDTIDVTSTAHAFSPTSGRSRSSSDSDLLDMDHLAVDRTPIERPKDLNRISSGPLPTGESALPSITIEHPSGRLEARANAHRNPKPFTSSPKPGEQLWNTRLLPATEDLIPTSPTTPTLSPTQPPKTRSPPSTFSRPGSPFGALDKIGAPSPRHEPRDPTWPSDLSPDHRTVVGKRRPSRLDVDAIHEAEARGSLTSLNDLIRRATKLRTNLDRGKTASRLGMDFFATDGEGGSPKLRTSRSLSSMLGALNPSDAEGVRRSQLRHAAVNLGSISDEGEAAGEKEGTIATRKRNGARRRCCGLPLWAFWLLLVVLVLMVAAAVVVPVVLLIVLPMERGGATS